MSFPQLFENLFKCVSTIESYKSEKFVVILNLISYPF